MRLRLCWVCHDCHVSGTTTCRDGGPAFITDTAGQPLEWDSLPAVNFRMKTDLAPRAGMDLRVLAWDQIKGWQPIAPEPKKKSVLD